MCYVNISTCSFLAVCVQLIVNHTVLKSLFNQNPNFEPITCLSVFEDKILQEGAFLYFNLNEDKLQVTWFKLLCYPNAKDLYAKLIKICFCKM